MSRSIKEAGLSKSEVVELIQEHLGENWSRSDLENLCSNVLDLNYPYWATWKDYRVDRGVYSTDLLRSGVGSSKPKKSRSEKKAKPSKKIKPAPEAQPAPTFQHVQKFDSEPIEDLIPAKDPLYVKWGAYSEVDTIIKSKKFFPMFITGLSGNGKTTMVDQCCAQNGRELIRVNFTRLTDEDQLIGGWRLVNGNTVWFDGPVVRAMKLGAVLLLDEVDLADEKVMCLQPILEGKGIFVKPTREMVHHKEGFTIFATGNTKGQGDETGKFAGTFQMNEAFLERFPLSIEQPYPKKTHERKMLNKVFGKNDILDKDDQEHYIEHLLEFVSIVRSGFEVGEIPEVISTRRLIQIVQTFLIFKDKTKALDLCLNRFNLDVQALLKKLYQGCEPKTKAQLAEEEAEKLRKEEEAKKAQEAQVESKHGTIVDAFNGTIS